MNFNRAENWIVDSLADLKARTSTARSHASRYNRLYTFLALFVFLSGVLISLYSLDWSNIRIYPALIAVNVLLYAPLTIILKAISLQTAGRVIDQQLRFKSAFGASALATISNVLPIPAGTAIQSAALMKKGATLSRGGGVIVFGNVVSFSVVAVVLGISLYNNGRDIGVVIMTVGLVLLALFSVVTIRASRTVLAAQFMGIRIARVLLMVARIHISFLAIGIGIELTQAASFTAAIVLGSATVFVPAGLGVSEALAALTAVAVSVSPAAAFIAVAMNRLVTLSVAAIATAFMLNSLRRAS